MAPRRSIWKSAQSWAQQVLSCGQCAVCHTWHTRQGSVVCQVCTDRFSPPVSRCWHCGIEVPTGLTRCLRCLRHPPRQRYTLAALSYEYPWDRLIAALKFHDQPGLAPTLARQLATTVKAAPWAAVPDWVLPMPMSPQRLRERGIHHTWMLTRAVARHLHLPASPEALQRVHDTPPQATLPRSKRLDNVRDAFVVAPDWMPRLRGTRVAVVDDVMTTGASLDATARALLAAGVAEVHAWVLARTPHAAAAPVRPF